MSIKTTRRLAASVLAFVLLVAAECSAGYSYSRIIAEHSADITATNSGGERVVLVLNADDAYDSGSVSPGREITITTHINGSYTVLVLEGAGRVSKSLDDALDDLRRATTDLYAARASNNAPDMTALTNKISEARQAVQAARFPEGALASCTGFVRFPAELAPSPQPIALHATVTMAADGVWSAACPSH